MIRFTWKYDVGSEKMKFENIDWADSRLEKIDIEYDIATLLIWNDTLQEMLSVRCIGLAGITNLCIWDDLHIMKAEIDCVNEKDNEFISKLYSAYDKEFDYGGRKLTGLISLNIELSNYICFSIYCLDVNIEAVK